MARIVVAAALVDRTVVAVAIVAACIGLRLLLLLPVGLPLRLRGASSGEDEGRSRDACQTMKRNSHIDLS